MDLSVSPKVLNTNLHLYLTVREDDLKGKGVLGRLWEEKQGGLGGRWERKVERETQAVSMGSGRGK
jgi:hypothetical protein